MSSQAFAPGHITGFFVPSDNLSDMERIGSTGAGFSVKLGARAQANVGGSDWDIYVNGVHTAFSVVEKAICGLARGGTVDITTELPFSQGFGMSGACALSSALAVCEEMDLPRERAVRAAHLAEVFCRTGLGDVVAQSVGGFETRLKPGLPPFGEIVSRCEEREVVLGVSGGPLITPDVLGDPSFSEWIRMIGEECMEDHRPDNGMEKFCELSKRFALETQFMRDDIKEILSHVEGIGMGSMSMIGNSVFLIGNTDEIHEYLVDRLGKERVYLTSIDNQGARYL